MFPTSSKCEVMHKLSIPGSFSPPTQPGYEARFNSCMGIVKVLLQKLVNCLRTHMSVYFLAHYN